MRKFIFAALATAVLAPASLFAGSASAQVVPFSKFQQLLDQNQITTAYAARGGRGGGGFHGGGRVHAASVRRPAGMRAGGYRGYRGNVARAGVYRGNVYRGNVARAGVYRGVATRSYAGRYYNGRYYNRYNRPYAAYGRPYYRGAYYGGAYRPYYGGSYYPYGAAATGALVGAAIASQPVVTGSVGSNASAYCAQRYRSYNPATGTFTGYDGRQRRCP